MIWLSAEAVLKQAQERLRQYETARVATEEWLAIPDPIRPIVSPPGVPVYEWYGEDIPLLIEYVKRYLDLEPPQ